MTEMSNNHIMNDMSYADNTSNTPDKSCAVYGYLVWHIFSLDNIILPHFQEEWSVAPNN